MTDPPRCGVHNLIADVAVFAAGQVALVRYRNPGEYDGEAGWFLPDDGIAYLEHPQRAAKRILREQLGLEVSHEPVLAHFESFKGDNQSWHLSWHYRVDLPKTPELRPGAMIGEARWLPLDRLPPKDEVAHHGWALQILRAMNRRTP